MRTSLFDFHLPEHLIAQEPLPDRDASRMLHLDRSLRTWSDRTVRDLPGVLQPGDLLVFNDTKVIPARLRARRDATGGKVEFLLLPPDTSGSTGLISNVATCETAGCLAVSQVATQLGRTTGLQTALPQPFFRRVLTRSGGTLKLDESFTLDGGCKVTLRERLREAGDRIEIHSSPGEFEAYVLNHGEVPLPPYIRRPPGPSSSFDKHRYQTVYAQSPGAVAAPTAGLHFSSALMDALRARGVLIAYLTLHVGPGTFRPVKAENVHEHFVDPEPYFIPEDTVAAVASAKRDRRRVIAVGTTSLRALEGCDVQKSAIAQSTIEHPLTPRSLSLTSALSPRGEGNQHSNAGQTDLFIYPPRKFAVVDGLLTNFHIPKSSLLMLVCALAAPGTEEGIGFVKNAYEHAVKHGYRFYSYGDACLVL